MYPCHLLYKQNSIDIIIVLIFYLIVFVFNRVQINGPMNLKRLKKKKNNTIKCECDRARFRPIVPDNNYYYSPRSGVVARDFFFFSLSEAKSRTAYLNVTDSAARRSNKFSIFFFLFFVHKQLSFYS